MADVKSKKGQSSPQKRVKQNESRRIRNRAESSKVKTSVKNVLTTIASGENENIDAVLLKAIKDIDKLQSKGIIHKRTASRKISRLTKRVNAVKTA